MTTYTLNPALVTTTINGIGYQIPYTQAIPNTLPNLTGYPSGVAGVVQDWWSSEDQTTWTQEPDPEPPAPEPDWTNFNLAMIPPATESSFEVWLGQFKIPYQTPLTTAAGMGNLQETQQIYNSLKAIASDPNNTLVPPTQEYITEWQAIADTYHIGVIF